MNRFAAILSAAALLGAASVSQAGTVTTLSFNGDAIINQFTASPSSSNLGSRILYQNYGVTDPNGGPYTVTASTYNDPADYASWVPTVSGAAEGVNSFELWLQGGAPDSSFGENIGFRPGTMPTTTQPTGWSSQIIDASTIYGGQAAGYYQIIYYTNTPADFIRSGSSIGDFTVTGQFAHIIDPLDPYWPSNADLGSDLLPGQNAQIWFGLANGPSSDLTAPTQNIFFNGGGWTEGWNSAFDTTGGGGTGMEGNLAAVAVPEPGSVALCLLGSLSILGFRGRRKR